VRVCRSSHVLCGSKRVRISRCIGDEKHAGEAIISPLFPAKRKREKWKVGDGQKRRKTGEDEQFCTSGAATNGEREWGMKNRGGGGRKRGDEISASPHRYRREDKRSSAANLRDNKAITGDCRGRDSANFPG